MNPTQVQDPEYQRYLTDAQAEVDAMLAPSTTPDPAPTAPAPAADPLLKVLIVAVIAVVVFVVGMLLFRGRRPIRSMA